MVPENKLETLRVLNYSWGLLLKPKLASNKKKHNGPREYAGDFEGPNLFLGTIIETWIWIEKKKKK